MGEEERPSGATFGHKLQRADPLVRTARSLEFSGLSVQIFASACDFLGQIQLTSPVAWSWTSPFPISMDFGYRKR